MLQNREIEFPLSQKLEENLSRLLVSLNRFRQAYGKPMHVTSGYRPGYYNSIAGGAPTSSHITCEAADFADTDRAITNYILSNPRILVDSGLYMEAPADTPSWVHLTTRAPRSGNRIFNK